MKTGFIVFLFLIVLTLPKNTYSKTSLSDMFVSEIKRYENRAFDIVELNSFEGVDHKFYYQNYNKRGKEDRFFNVFKQLR